MHEGRSFLHIRRPSATVSYSVKSSPVTALLLLHDVMYSAHYAPADARPSVISETVQDRDTVTMDI